MLACYPIEAASENWLHNTIVEVIKNIHDRFNSGHSIAENQTSWKSLLTTNIQAAHKDAIYASRGIRDRAFIYKNLVEQLTSVERQTIFSVLESQNCIVELLENSLPPATIEIQFPDVHHAALDLFEFCFKKLTDFKVRERQYEIIFNHLETKICPFCGIERVMNPEETAQDQDHYLAKSIYPFCAANLRNLVPMCRCCNRDYKKAIDIIRGVNQPRRAFDPYDCQPPSLTLRYSAPPMDASPPIPNWQIDFVPATEEADTWDDVFKIRTRYKRDILTEYFSKWLDGFVTKCRKDRQRGIIQGELNITEIRLKLEHYYEDKASSPNIGMAGFLEPLVFEYFLEQFDQGNQRIINLVKDAVIGLEI